MIDLQEGRQLKFLCYTVVLSVCLLLLIKSLNMQQCNARVRLHVLVDLE